jgi:nucleotide sugar dehydrogenase
MKDLPRVIGAVTETGRDRAVSFYDSLLDAAVHPVGSPSVAEASKIIENAFRDVNIAFVNEVARSLSELEIDAIESLDAAATKPFGFMRFEPGAGVGGHCIPVDPYLLIDQAQQSGFDHQLLKLSRDINDGMPSYVVDQTVRALNGAEILPKGSEILLLGRAFKGEIDDTRNSPSYAIESELSEYGCEVDIYDPFVPEESTVETPYTGADAVVLVTDHTEFEALELGDIADAGTEVFVDGRNVFTPEDAVDLSIEYVAIGR